MENKPSLLYFIAATLFLLTCAQGCKKDNPFRKIFQKDNRIELEQTITSTVRPTDSLFIQFDKNWKKLVSQRAELLRPVKFLDLNQVKTPWNPLVISDCVFSPGAGANVPQVDISWVEDLNKTGDAPIRVDLALLYRGYENDTYTTVFPVESQKRFNMPLNSKLILDSAAVLIAGVALFPKLTHYSLENLVAATDNTPSVQFQKRAENLKKYHIVLEELGPGLSYKLRVCRFNGEIWQEEKHYVFSTPICTQKF